MLYNELNILLKIETCSAPDNIYNFLCKRRKDAIIYVCYKNNLHNSNRPAGYVLDYNDTMGETKKMCEGVATLKVLGEFFF